MFDILGETFKPQILMKVGQCQCLAICLSSTMNKIWTKILRHILAASVLSHVFCLNFAILDTLNLELFNNVLFLMQKIVQNQLVEAELQEELFLFVCLCVCQCVQQSASFMFTCPIQGSLVLISDWHGNVVNVIKLLPCEIQASFFFPFTDLVWQINPNYLFM